MLNTIVIPIDGSALSEQALDYAQKVLDSTGTLILVTVLDVPTEIDYIMSDVPLMWATVRPYTEKELDSAVKRVQEYLDHLSKHLRLKGYTIETVVESGEPADIINTVANNKNADAVVMTTHGRTGLNRFLFGSVTQKVLAHMVCPVLVVPGKVIEKVKVPIQSQEQVPATS